MSHIILEDRFSTHQKIVFFIFLELPLINFLASFFKNFNALNFLFIILIGLLTLSVLGFSLIKLGFIEDHGKLYLGNFLCGKLIFKEKVKLKNKPKLCILKFKKRQRLGFMSSAKPNMCEEFECFDVNILNENHTKRNNIISLKEETNSQKAVSFLTTKFHLKHEIYHPNFE
jgi:hypothetical protein